MALFIPGRTPHNGRLHHIFLNNEITTASKYDIDHQIRDYNYSYINDDKNKER